MALTQGKTLAFRGGTLVLSDRVIENGVLVCVDGHIAALGKADQVGVPPDATIIEAQGGHMAPGFVDLHVHGGDGADFMDGTPEAVKTAIGAHTRHGTTTIFPTTTTGSRAQVAAMLDACARVRQSWKPADGAKLEGVHFYGPYFAADKVGCHLESGRRDPDVSEYGPALGSDLVRIATCAAELPGAEAFYRLAEQRGCLVTCGHSNASWTEMARAFNAGVRHVDHFWCAMSSVPSVSERLGTPMQGSMEQFVLYHPDMSTEVIADGEHLAAELLEFAHRLKGVERLCLVTDSSRALDMPPGSYRFGPQADGERFESDGRKGFIPGSGLASSVRGMDHMVRHMARHSGAGLVGAVRMASLTPAQRVGMAQEFGSLAVGKRADVVVLDRDLAAVRTFVQGVEFKR